MAARSNGQNNKLALEDQPVHGWYRFVLSFPPHLVRDYIQRFRLTDGHRLLDPFCGTGTTLVEAKKLGIASVGIEANPMAYLASLAKIDWTPDSDGLLEHARRVGQLALQRLESDGIEDNALFPCNPPGQTSLRALSPEQAKLLLTGSMSPLPLHKTLVLLDCLAELRDDRFHRHEIVALANALVKSIGNLEFGPEVGVGPAKADAPVVSAWLAGIRSMAEDLRAVEAGALVPSSVHKADSRDLQNLLEPDSVDAVITSPPYPNEKDYTRTTRLESVLLGLIRDRRDLRALKDTLVRSNTRGVYKGDDDHRWVETHPEIERIAREIERRRIELNKTSGFERMYPRVTRLYFGGMVRHLAALRTVLRPGAKLAYVVGDQASYLRVMIRTGQLLADLARSLGYEVLGIDLFRTRLATATRDQLREEVVVLGWPGPLPARDGEAPGLISAPSGTEPARPR